MYQEIYIRVLISLSTTDPPNPVIRYRKRLLSIGVMLVILWDILALAIEYFDAPIQLQIFGPATATSLVVFLIVYRLNQSGHYYMAANLGIAMLSIQVYTDIYVSFLTQYTYSLLLFLGPVLLSTILLGFWESLTYFLLLVIGVFFLPFNEDLYRNNPSVFVFMFYIGLLILFLNFHLDRLTKIRMQQEMEYEKERNLKDEQLKMTQMEAIGRFASGIAHDLQAILPEISDETTRKRTERVYQELAAISPLGTGEFQPLDINKLLRQMDRSLFEFTGEQTEVVLDLSTEPGVIHADRIKIQYAIFHLAKNAREAMNGKGILRIYTTLEVKYDGQGGKTQYVVIRFNDEGVGIPKENIDSIFDPFFTTKKDAAGLGLSMVKALVNQSNGFVKVNSEVGYGTTVTLYFPRIMHVLFDMPRKQRRDIEDFV